MGDLRRTEFLQTCLLLLLRERPAHGFVLVERMRAFSERFSDRGTVYRLLRGLEREGLVRSTWRAATPIAPPRHVYRITTKGIVRLAARAEDLEAAHRELHSFLDRYALIADRP